MTELEKVLDELKKIGYTDEKLKELVELTLPDIQEQLFLDLAAACSDQELDAFKKKTETARTKIEVDEILEEMAKRAYGDSYKEKLEAMTAAELREAAELTLKIRETYQKYMDGDPETKKQVEEYEKSAEYQKVKKDMEDAGFDFKAAASK